MRRERSIRRKERQRRESVREEGRVNLELEALAAETTRLAAVTVLCRSVRVGGPEVGWGVRSCWLCSSQAHRSTAQHSTKQSGRYDTIRYDTIPLGCQAASVSHLTPRLVHTVATVASGGYDPGASTSRAQLSAPLRVTSPARPTQRSLPPAHVALLTERRSLARLPPRSGSTEAELTRSSSAFSLLAQHASLASRPSAAHRHRCCAATRLLPSSSAARVCSGRAVLWTSR